MGQTGRVTTADAFPLAGSDLNDGAGTTQAEVAYSRIWSSILSGQLAPGSRLVEVRLAAEFDMSRTPIREAIHRLQAEGLVLGERNKGAVVRPITVSDVRDLYNLRARLESYSAALAAERRTLGELECLAAAAAEFDAAVERLLLVTRRTPRATTGVTAANARFHALMLEASRHARLQQMLARAVDVPLVHRAFALYDAEHLRGSARFHHLILDAIAQGDGDRAERLAREHVLQSRDVLLDEIAARADDWPASPPVPAPVRPR